MDSLINRPPAHMLFDDKLGATPKIRIQYRDDKTVNDILTWQSSVDNPFLQLKNVSTPW